MEKRRQRGAMDLREVGEDTGSTAIGSHMVRRGIRKSKEAQSGRLLPDGEGWKTVLLGVVLLS